MEKDRTDAMPASGVWLDCLVAMLVFTPKCARLERQVINLLQIIAVPTPAFLHRRSVRPESEARRGRRGGRSSGEGELGKPGRYKPGLVQVSSYGHRPKHPYDGFPKSTRSKSSLKQTSNRGAFW